MIGLSPTELQTLRAIFARFPEIKEVILFGSRAHGTHRNGSDVDLAIKGENIGIDTLAKLKYILEEETDLPYFFDVVVYGDIKSEALKREMDRNGKLIL